MKKKTWMTFCFLLLCVSCAPGYRTATDMSQPVFEKIPETESYEEAVDTSCSYFYYLWGKTAELQRKYDEALEAYQKALVCDRQAYHVMRNLAVLLIKVGKHQQAVSWINKMIEQDPADTQSRSLLANLYMSLGKVDEAAKVFREILDAEPENLNAMLMLGSLYARNRQYSEAREILEKLVELEPESYSGHYYLAKLYQELRFYDKSLAAYEKALSLNWSAMLSFEAAALYEYQEKYDDALKLYERVLSENEENEQVRALLVNVYLRKGDTDRALEELEKLRSFSEDPKKVDFTIGRILLDEKRFDEAIALFSRMLKENPKLDGARSMLVMAYYQKEDLSNAKQILRQVQPGDHGYADSLLMLVKILRDEKNMTGAEEVLEKAIADTTGREISFYAALAMLYQEQGKIDKGHQVFEKANKDYPDNPKVTYEYSMFLDKIGDVDGALVKMEEVLRREPDNPFALNYVGYMLAEKGEKLEKALEYIEKAVSIKPEDGFIRDSLGWVYYKLGDFDKAIAELEKASEIVPDDPTIHEHLGDVYMKVNKYQSALISYSRSLNLYEDEKKKEQVRRKIEAMNKK